MLARIGRLVNADAGARVRQRRGLRDTLAAMTEFVHDALPGRVVFAAGALARVGDEVARLGAGRVLLIAGASQAQAAAAVRRDLAGRLAGFIGETAMHVPILLAEAARATAREAAADVIVCIGGGSATGLAKAVALDVEIPIVAVPTTYSGSEMTAIWGITEAGEKRTGRDIRVLPRTVIYDPELTHGLELAIAAPSGINAIAHCVEALYAENANPVTSMMAVEGISAMAGGLRAIARDGGDADGRARALMGAYLAGASLAAAAMGIHHKLCHVLGGAFGLAHAETHTVILPHATAFNRQAAPEAMARIAAALGTVDAACGIHDLAAELGAPLSLAAIGMAEDGLDRAAEMATAAPYANPAPVEIAAVRALLGDAYAGRRPG